MLRAALAQDLAAALMHPTALQEALQQAQSFPELKDRAAGLKPSRITLKMRGFAPKEARNA